MSIRASIGAEEPAEGTERAGLPETGRRTLIALLLFGITVAAFARVSSHAFLGYDDGGYVANNARVQAGLTLANVRWAFTTFDMANWHPLTWLSYMLDCTLYGLDPRGHHLTNVGLHALNAVLVFLVLDAMTGALARSALVAALFALHPLHVESVAWVAERKDVLSTLFALLAIAAYVRWTRAPSLGRYSVVLIVFALALMAKPMVVTLPFVLLLLDGWPLRRWPGRTAARLIGEKVPLFVLSAVSSVLTVVAQGTAGAIRSIDDLSIGDRVANTVVSYAAYLARTFWPVDLTCFYPYREVFPPTRVAGAAALLAGLTLLAVWQRRRLPALLVGWLWYLGTLVPVIGIVQVGPQAMADRYSYVPLIGIFLAVVWVIGDVLALSITAREDAAAPSRAGTVLAGLVVCFVLTRRQVEYWQDGVTLFAHALAVHGDDDTIHYHLCSEALRLDRLDAAIAHCDRAVAVTKPRPGERASIATVLERQGWPPSRAAEQAASLTGTLGIMLWQRGRADEATAYFATTVRLQPARADAHNNLGLTHAAAGHDGEALAEFAEALRLRPEYADARYNRGNVLARQGHVEEAITDYRAALDLEPNLHEARNNLALALERVGAMEAAIREFRAAIDRAPDYVDPRVNLGTLLARTGRLDEATTQYREALRVAPAHPEAHYGLGNVLAERGRHADAIVEYEAALTARPTFSAARGNLERARDAAGRNGDHRE